MLIILYGALTKKYNEKYQKMLVDGGSVCGYREYARKYGKIIYLSKQNTRLDWESSITSTDKVISYLNKYPEAIIWAVKHDPKRDKSILSKIDHKKIYYSCCSRNVINNFCDYSLVDCKSRISKNAVVWFKGKDENFWQNLGQKKEFDYLLIGKRADKNELYFLQKLNRIKEKRKILWIGGKNHSSRVKSIHEVHYIPFGGAEFVRDNIGRAKVGILFTEHKSEGFPQSFLEMTMCGVPIVYNKKGPRNKYYIHTNNCVLCMKKNLIKASESLLADHDSILCHEDAVVNYSLQKSYNYIKDLFNG